MVDAHQEMEERMAAAQRVPGKNIPIATVLNLRDLGGRSRPTGKVRPGLVYGSTECATLQGEAAAAFGDLGVRTVYGLRTKPDRDAQPNVIPCGVGDVLLDIVKD
jgi:protein-tyrosine phosphatase